MRKLLIATIAVALAFSAFAPALKADTMAYASTNGGLLYIVDLSNATAKEIGNTGVSAIEGLSVSPGGTLYGTDGSGNLYTINQSTGAATLIGSTGLGDTEGLAFDGSTLLAAPFNYDLSTSTTLYSINTATAAATSVITATTGAVRGMTLENSNDVFVTSDKPTFMSLETVNLTSGAVTDDGALADTSGGFVEVTSLAYNGSTLWGLDTSGNEYTINPLTGAETLVGNVDTLFFLDMTLAPTAAPEPSSISLLLLGLVGIGTLVAVSKRKPLGQSPVS